jgi:transcriptional regulator with XRE-family HTH domain
VSFDSQGFGRRLAAARAWRGLQPKEIAAHVGLSAEAINRWERGGIRRPPNKATIRGLAELLEQDEAWLLRGTTPPWLENGSLVVSQEADLQARRHDELLTRLDAQDEVLRVLMARFDAVLARLE